MSFLSWEVANGLRESIIKTNREGKIIILASQKYSKKVQDRMNSLLLKKKEFKKDEVKKTWKSYVKFLGVLMVKKPTDEKNKVFDWWWKSQQMKKTKFLTVDEKSNRWKI